MNGNTAEQRSEVIVSGRAEAPVTLSPGVTFHSLISGEIGASGLTTGIASLRPGIGLPMHTHSMSEVIIPLCDQIRVQVEGRQYQLQKYDAIHVPAAVPHCVTNDSDDSEAECFVAFASEVPDRDWVDEIPCEEKRDESDALVPEHLTRFAAAEVYELADNALFRDLFAGRFGAAGICGGYGVFQPGASLPCHTHGFDESITIVEGAAVCQVAGRQYDVSGLDTACVPEGLPHRFINQSGGPMAMIWVYAGDEPDRTVVDQCLCQPGREAGQTDILTDSGAE